MANVREIVKDIIAEDYSVDMEKITDDAKFGNDLGMDSLDQVELVMELEKRFSISVPDDEAEKMITVGDMFAYLERNVN